MRRIIISAVITIAITGTVHAYDWCPENNRAVLEGQTGVVTGPRWVDRSGCIRVDPAVGRHGRPTHLFSNTCNVWILIHACFPPGTENYNQNFLACPKLIGEEPNQVPTAQLERIFWLRPYEKELGHFAAGQIYWAVSCESG